MVQQQIIRASKHEGAGNDFLVLIDLDDAIHLDEAEIRSLCDRRHGVGADGFIRVFSGAGVADVTMELTNADGSRAETSGNGLRCLAQAVVDAGLVDPHRFRVATGAGVSSVEFEARVEAEEAWATVDMGPVSLIGRPGHDSGGRPTQQVDTGNPHLVVRCEDPAEIDLERDGAALAEGFPGGINVEYVAPGPGPDQITLRVFERGVGETRACGSGSCAAAAVARSWGVVGDRVRVSNPGGTLEVSLGRKNGDPVLLSGPVRRIALVEVDRSTLS